MKRVIKITKEGSVFTHFLQLSEAQLISQILQDCPGETFTVQLVEIDKDYYNSMFGYSKVV